MVCAFATSLSVRVSRERGFLTSYSQSVLSIIIH
mgnify:CR=1 FL=1